MRSREGKCPSPAGDVITEDVVQSAIPLLNVCAARVLQGVQPPDRLRELYEPTAGYVVDVLARYSSRNWSSVR
jgi:hypothetical protein